MWESLLPIIANNPLVSGGQQIAVDLYFFKKHALALSRVLTLIEDKVRDMYSDEHAFASFIFYCLSMTIGVLKIDGGTV